MNRFSLMPILLLAAGASAQIQYCTITDAGEGCGPTLTVTMDPLGQGGNYRLTMVASGLHPRAAGAINWGANPQSVPLPGGGCLLLCDYVWGHYFQTDAFGEHTWGRAWPNTFIGYFYMQMGSMMVDEHGELSVLTTNCKLVQCF